MDVYEEEIVGEKDMIGNNLENLLDQEVKTIRSIGVGCEEDATDKFVLCELADSGRPTVSEHNLEEMQNSLQKILLEERRNLVRGHNSIVSSKEREFILVSNMLKTLMAVLPEPLIVDESELNKLELKETISELSEGETGLK